MATDHPIDAEFSDQAVEPLRAESLASLVYESMRESILNGRFKRGQHLVEARLAGQFGVSRGPVREALRRLEEEFLVVERPRRGKFVRELDEKDLTDIYNVRLIIETASARLSARRRANTSKLATYVSAMEDAATRGALHELVEAELAFHAEICVLSGNAFLPSLFRVIASQVRLALEFDDEGYEDLGELAREHIPIVERINAGDERGAALVIQEHIRTTSGGKPARGINPSDLLPIGFSLDAEVRDDTPGAPGGQLPSS
jgi:DNA-binding GntR family transcriptional regulator